MKSTIASLVAMFVFVVGLGMASAQGTSTPTSKLLADQIAVDLVTAQGYVYTYYPDGAATGTVITVTCTGTASPFTCSGAFPAFTPGAHSLTLTAKNAAGESVKSPVLTFTFVVIPNAPQNLRIGDDEFADADYVLYNVTVTQN